MIIWTEHDVVIAYFWNYFEFISLALNSFSNIKRSNIIKRLAEQKVEDMHIPFIMTIIFGLNQNKEWGFLKAYE